MRKTRLILILFLIGCFLLTANGLTIYTPKNTQPYTFLIMNITNNFTSIINYTTIFNYTVTYNITNVNNYSIIFNITNENNYTSIYNYTTIYNMTIENNYTTIYNITNNITNVYNYTTGGFTDFFFINNATNSIRLNDTYFNSSLSLNKMSISPFGNNMFSMESYTNTISNYFLNILMNNTGYGNDTIHLLQLIGYNSVDKQATGISFYADGNLTRHADFRYYTSRYPDRGGLYFYAAPSTERYLYPASTNTYDFGKSNYCWKNLYYYTLIDCGSPSYELKGKSVLDIVTDFGQLQYDYVNIIPEDEYRHSDYMRLVPDELKTTDKNAIVVDTLINSMAISIYQMSDKIKQLENKISILENKLKAIEGKT